MGSQGLRGEWKRQASGCLRLSANAPTPLELLDTLKPLGVARAGKDLFDLFKDLFDLFRD